FTLSFTATSPTQISPLSLHDALPICKHPRREFQSLAKAGHGCFIGRLALNDQLRVLLLDALQIQAWHAVEPRFDLCQHGAWPLRSEEHTSELQSRFDLVCRLLLEKKK